MADLDELALSLPQSTKKLTSDGRHTRHLLHHPHFDGYAAVLVRIPELERLDRDELGDLVAEAWLTRAQKRLAKAWLAEQHLERNRFG